MEAAKSNEKDEMEITETKVEVYREVGGKKVRVYEAKKNCWCFTWNNYPIDYKEKLAKLLPHASFMVYGLEVGDKCHTPHVQGYVRFAKGKAATTLHNIIEKCYFVPAKGDDQANLAYCSKQDPDFFQYGEPKSQGKRNDIIAIREAVQEKKSMRDMLTDGTLVNYQGIRVAEKLLDYFEPARHPSDGTFTFEWWYGTTGVGKSYDALMEYPGYYSFTQKDMKWWNGYDAHIGVIIDDFRDTMGPMSEFLRIWQPFPHRVEAKGVMRQLRAMSFIATTCHSPLQVYRGILENRNQLYRRITGIRRYYDKNTYVKQKFNDDYTALVDIA
nr:putative replication associated protein [Crucivirus sp.]